MRTRGPTSRADFASGAARVEVGDLVHADILAGEIADGRAAGIGREYMLRGVGLVPMREVYAAEDLTDACRPTDTCWAAEVTVVPRVYQTGPRAGQERAAKRP